MADRLADQNLKRHQSIFSSLSNPRGRTEIRNDSLKVVVRGNGGIHEENCVSDKLKPNISSLRLIKQGDSPHSKTSEEKFN